MDEAVGRQFPDDRFVTAVTARLDRAAVELLPGPDPIHSGPAPLPPATLFGRRKRITIRFDQRRTRRSGPPPLGAVNL